MSAGGLPPPMVLQSLLTCPRCGYDLSGTAVTLPCPECGQPNGACVQLAGTPNRLGGKTHRRVARVIAVIGAWLGLQIVFIMWFRVSMLTGLLVLAVFVLGIVWLMVSSPRERRAAEKFLFVPGFIVRLPLLADTGVFSDALRIPLEAGDTLRLKPVGTKWARICLQRQGGSTPFDAGFLVDVESLPQLARSLQEVQGPSISVVVDTAPR
jgi:hypothetical protein